MVAFDMAHTPTSNRSDCSNCAESKDCFNIFMKNEIEDKIVNCDRPQPCTPVGCIPGPGILCSLPTCTITECQIKNVDCLPFERSDDVKNVMDCSFKEREQYTSGTHYTDLDNLYGATTQQTEDVRAYVDGLLKNDIVSLKTF